MSFLNDILDFSKNLGKRINRLLGPSQLDRMMISKLESLLDRVRSRLRADQQTKQPSSSQKTPENPGSKLREWRKSNGLSQAKAAKMIQVKQAHWSRIEKGIGKPSCEKAIEIELLTKGVINTKMWGFFDKKGGK